MNPKIESCKTCGKTPAAQQKWYQSAWDVCYGHTPRVSELEEAACLSDDDYLPMVDTSEKKSVKVKLGALKEYFR